MRNFLVQLTLNQINTEPNNLLANCFIKWFEEQMKAEVKFYENRYYGMYEGSIIIVEDLETQIEEVKNSVISLEKWYKQIHSKIQNKEYNYIQPSHYELWNDNEDTLNIIKAVLTPEEFEGFCKGNILKYQLRIGKKPNEPVERDVNKIAEYRKYYKDFQSYTKAIVCILLFLFISSCTYVGDRIPIEEEKVIKESEVFKKGKRQLDMQGYVNIKETTQNVFCCSKSDSFWTSTGFEATYKFGEKVSGCICEKKGLRGLAGSSITIRFQ